MFERFDKILINPKKYMLLIAALCALSGIGSALAALHRIEGIVVCSGVFIVLLYSSLQRAVLVRSRKQEDLEKIAAYLRKHSGKSA